MAKARGPLSSEDASGSLADSLTWSQWRGRKYIRGKGRVANPRSSGQLSARAVLAFCARRFPTLDQAVKDFWSAQAEKNKTTGVNAWIADSQNQRNLELGPRTTPTAIAGDQGFLFGISPFGEFRKTYKIESAYSISTDQFTILLYRSAESGFLPTMASLVAILPFDPLASSFTYQEKNVPTGTWFMIGRIAGHTGQLGSETGEAAIVVL